MFLELLQSAVAILRCQRSGRLTQNLTANLSRDTYCFLIPQQRHILFFNITIILDSQPLSRHILFFNTTSETHIVFYHNHNPHRHPKTRFNRPAVYICFFIVQPRNGRSLASAAAASEFSLAEDGMHLYGCRKVAEAVAAYASSLVVLLSAAGRCLQSTAGLCNTAVYVSDN